jgi:hypothetical protein
VASIREQAVADILAAAVTTTAMGETLTIDGASVVAVRSELSAEERMASGLDGTNTESMVLTMATASLSAVPVPRQAMTVAGADWDVLRVREIEGLLTVVLQRYVG